MNGDNNQNSGTQNAQNTGSTHTDPIPGTGLPDGHAENKLAAVLAYIGPLVIVSFLMAKDDAFVKFHTKQGLLLFGLEIIVGLSQGPFMLFFPVYTVLYFIIMIACVIGIVNVLSGKEKELPVIGKYAHIFKF